MEIHKTCDEEKWENLNPKPAQEEEPGNEEEEEEEEEALSLCDLPVNLIREDNQTRHRDDEAPASFRTEDDFDFGSWGGSVPREPEMCAADDVFFKGQILPLPFSGSSDGGWSALRQDSQNPSRCISRSESMDHGSISRLTSIHSSRSSSTRSHYSSTSSSSATNSTSQSNSNRIRIRNNFQTHPSPKPQIRSSKTRVGNPNPRTQRSTLWDFLKLGLIRAPEIELQDFKARNSFSINNNNNNRISVSRNSSCSSSNSNGSGSTKNHQQFKRGLLEIKRLGLFGGCKCSVKAIETVPLNDVVLVKSCKRSEEGVGVEKKKMTIKKEEKGKEKEKIKRQGKQALSRRRTSEWLKELSNVSYDGDEA